jgi:hypothetical protein
MGQIQHVPCAISERPASCAIRWLGLEWYQRVPMYRHFRPPFEEHQEAGLAGKYAFDLEIRGGLFAKGLNLARSDDVIG